MKRLALLLLFATALPAQQTRIASDFEIAQMKQQIARSRDFLSQLSGHLNLGDLYLTRNETATARGEYARALEIAGSEALAARKASDITRYATAVAYSALANAKLGFDTPAFNAAEESIRYTSGSAKSWNLYSTAMTLLHRNGKAVSAARNAVAIASRELAQSPTVPNRLDLAVYENSLASALIENGDTAEAERQLRTIAASLQSNDFASLRRNVARTESFEIYSTARGDESAYLSLVNRAGLRLAALLEKRGDSADARAEYEHVLEMRTDDPTALTALARLSPPAEQERYFAAAFDANPFSMTLIREYQKHLASGQRAAPADDSTTGGQVRTALVQMARGETRAARDTLDALIAKFPQNDTLRELRRETETVAQVPAFVSGAATNVSPAALELRQLVSLLQSEKLTPDQRAALDRITFTNAVTFDPPAATAPSGQTIFASGSIGDVRFRFSEPTAFTGVFGTTARLTYRILGTTEVNGADGLLVEPVRLEATR
ncbi:MAG TPA: tetratricopeptide repeat protein [Thermoanaerobaculia bacterium]